MFSSLLKNAICVPCTSKKRQKILWSIWHLVWLIMRKCMWKCLSKYFLFDLFLLHSQWISLAHSRCDVYCLRRNVELVSECLLRKELITLSEVYIVTSNITRFQREGRSCEIPCRQHFRINNLKPMASWC